MAVLQGRAGRLILAAAALAAALLLAPLALRGLVAGKLREAAGRRSWTISWRELRAEPMLGFAIRDLRVLDARGDTLCEAESLRVALDPLQALRLAARVRSATIAHLRVRAGARAAGLADSLEGEDVTEASRGSARPDRAARVRREADELVRVLLLPARRLPRLELRDVELLARSGSPMIRLAWLSLSHARGGARLRAAGALASEEAIPFEVDLAYDREDRLAGGARCEIPDPKGGSAHPLVIAIDGRVAQDRRRGVITLGDSTRVNAGPVSFRLAGRIQRAGPRFSLKLDAEDLAPRAIRDRLPTPLLGPLADLALRGSFDYHAALDLDLARPDSVNVQADVIPHGLAIDPALNRLPLASLAGPFMAAVHLPHDRIEIRDLSGANPHFRPLESLDSNLVHAVITNEDGGFFRHRGFNLEAVRRSIADNVHAAAWRRGAGTISMQLVRNLYLGHERTLSRKAQEVALTWVVEHLAGLDKRRLLEIYLNIIEWGPGVLGADEAAHYFFGHDAGHVDVAEALFLATVLPSPTHWRWRFEPDGTLRTFEREQMHFIGRAMIAKGWLADADLPPTDSLTVRLAGPALELLTGPRSAALAPAASAPPSAKR